MGTKTLLSCATLPIALTEAQCQRREFCRDATLRYVSIYELHDKWTELETRQMIGDKSHQVQMGRKYQICPCSDVSASQVGYKAECCTFKASCYVCDLSPIVPYVCLPT